jgi:hypothetical protein
MYRENKFSVPKLPPPGDRFSEMRYRKKTAADDAQEFDRYFARLNRTDRDDLVKEALKHPLLVAKYQLKGAPIFWLPDATDMLEVAGRTEGGRGTLRVLLDEGVMAAARNYLGPQPDDATTFMVLLTLTIYAVWLVGLAVFLAVSLRRLIKSRLRMPAEAWIIILLVLLSMLAPGPASHPRFRVPLEPYLCIASAAGYLALLARLTRRPPQELPIDD